MRQLNHLVAFFFFNTVITCFVWAHSNLSAQEEESSDREGSDVGEEGDDYTQFYHDVGEFIFERNIETTRIFNLIGRCWSLLSYSQRTETTAWKATVTMNLHFERCLLAFECTQIPCVY